MTKTITIDAQRCTQCGNCLQSCNAMLIQPTESGVPQPIDQAGDFCISCGHCVAACEFGAVSVDAITPDNSPLYDGVPSSSFEQFDRLARTRRSIRHFKKQPVERAKIEQLLDTARWAPSARNLLPVKWLVVNNPDTVRELASLVVDWFRPVETFHHITKMWDMGVDVVHRGAPCLLIAYTDPDAMWGDIDATIAVETLDLGATAMGLGACWAGFFIVGARNNPKINERLGLPGDRTIRAALMLGEVGDESYSRVPFRPEVDVRWVD